MDQGTDSAASAGLAEQPAQRSAFSSGSDQGMRILAYLISGVAVYGGLGWLGDRLLGTGFLLPIGIIVGAAASVYVIIRRFGQTADPTPLPIRRRHRRPSEEYAISRRRSW